MRNVLSVFRNTLRHRNLPVMMYKARLRLSHFERAQRKLRPEAVSWCRAHHEEFASFAGSVNSGLFRETQQFIEYLRARAQGIERTRGTPLWGGAHFALLYFLARLSHPVTVVETGVAFGWSSAAILAALDVNGGGELFSSDFPSIYEKNPESDIGLLVDTPLRKRWHLLLDGDRRNLKRIISTVSRIDFLHYDSDKSYTGREFAISVVKQKLSPNGILVFDDIGDNVHFRNYVIAHRAKFHVFEAANRYVGVIGL